MFSWVFTRCPRVFFGVLSGSGGAGPFSILVPGVEASEASRNGGSRQGSGGRLAGSCLGLCLAQGFVWAFGPCKYECPVSRGTARRVRPIPLTKLIVTAATSAMPIAMMRKKRKLIGFSVGPVAARSVCCPTIYSPIGRCRRRSSNSTSMPKPIPARRSRPRPKKKKVA